MDSVVGKMSVNVPWVVGAMCADAAGPVELYRAKEIVPDVKKSGHEMYATENSIELASEESGAEV